MHLLVQCEDCKQVIDIGKLDRLPQTSRLMAELGDIFFTHHCKRFDNCTTLN